MPRPRSSVKWGLPLRRQVGQLALLLLLEPQRQVPPRQDAGLRRQAPLPYRPIFSSIQEDKADEEEEEEEPVVEEIDPTFLEALPPDLRDEVLASHRAQVAAARVIQARNRLRRAHRQPRQQAGGQAQAPAAAAAPEAAAAAAPATADAAAASAAAPIPQQVAPAEAPLPAASVPAPAPAAPPASRRSENNLQELGIDPEFFAALPPDIQQELLAEQRRERQRQTEVERLTAGAQAAGDGDLATLLASFPADVREEVLLASDEATINSLPAALAAEARQVRERVMGPQAAAAAAAAAAADEMDAAAAAAVGAPVPGAPQAGDEAEETGMVQPPVRAVAPRTAAPALPPLRPGILGHTDDPLASMGITARGVGQSSAASRIMSAVHRIVGRDQQRQQQQDAGRPPRPRSRAPAGPEGDPVMALASIRALVAVLRHPQPVFRAQLQRLFLNLSQHSVTRGQVLRMLLALVREDLEQEEEEQQQQAAEGAVGGADESGDVRMGTPVAAATGLSLSEALGTAEVVRRESATSGSGSGGAIGDTTAERVSPMVVRRVLELLSHLCRSQQRVAESLLVLRVPGLVAAGVVEDRKGKGPADDSGADAGPLALEVLLRMLGSRSVLRNAQQVDQCLNLVSTILDRNLKAEKETEVEAAPAVPGAKAVLGQLDESLLAPLAELTCHPSVSTASFGRVCVVLKSLADLEPKLQPLLVRKLATCAGQLRNEAMLQLREIGATLSADESATPLTGAVGRQLLQSLKALNILAKSGVFATKPEAAADAGAKDAAAEPSKEGGTGVPSAAAAAADEETDAGIKADVAAAVESLASDLSDLWGGLSYCVHQVESGMGSPAAGAAGRHLIESSAASKLLPRGAAQIQPLVEALFVLSDGLSQGLGRARPFAIHHGRREVHGTEQGGVLPSPSALSMDSQADGMAPPSRADSLQRHGSRDIASGSAFGGLIASGQPSVIGFAERHRQLVNAYLRGDHQLLDRTMSVLLQHPRLVDFDNKRAFFKHKVRKINPPSFHVLRLTVRRDHVFEDSFQKLRMCSADEWRGKLQVSFLGEEGIDAGGLTREWYQVMAREIFNPGFSLFVNVPEGGTTFQPNPNSMVRAAALFGGWRTCPRSISPLPISSRH